MKAARYYGPGDIRIEQIPEPQVQDQQIKIKIAWNGICGSDLHCFLMAFVKFPTATVPDEITGETLPVTLGHEFSGTIVALGKGVSNVKYHVGQNVVVEPIISCMRPNCDPCTAGTRNLCPIVNCIGIGGFGGGLAEYISVDERHVHVLPDGISLEVGACIEPLAVAWHAVKRSSFKPGSKVLVQGAGPIGLFVLKVLKSIDPHAKVIVSEPTVLRRSFALRHGATLVIDPSCTDVVASVFQATDEKGVDIVFDAAGAQATMNSAILSLRPRGTLVAVASWEKPPTVDMNQVLLREITITASNTYTGIHPELLDAVAAGRFSDLEDMITSKVPLDDVVDKGIKALLNEKDSQVKILVHP